MKNFLGKIKHFTKQITEVENNLYTGKKDFLEIYERNAELEKEIEERTYELKVANQRMLTLQHIWDMMNSAKPISSVLKTTVETLQTELNYLSCVILQKENDENGEFSSIIAMSEDDTADKFSKLFKGHLNSNRLLYDKNKLIWKALSKNEITHSKDLRAGLDSLFVDLDEETVEGILSNAKCRSFIVLPLKTINKDFGVLCVMSYREELTEGELDFLKLFARQIELALTIVNLFQVVKDQAVTDALTGLYNRRYFQECLDKEVTRAKRQHQPFTIIGIDLDHLKHINDKFGHSLGDLAIQQISKVLKQNARSIDVPVRMGGEEFNVLLPGIDSTGGMKAAERIRKAIEDSPIEIVGKITASLGVATFLEQSDDVEELLELTDQAMYQSKRNGRNQVTLAKTNNQSSWQERAIDAFIDILSKQRVPVDENISKELCDKLKTTTADSNSPKEMVYTVADMLAKTYNPTHHDGSTKSKLLIATMLAKHFELAPEELDNLKVAMLLYDIGNLMLPKELLQKKEPLTEEEKEHIKEHPVIAAREILKPISNIQDVIPIIEKHHENWDGTGYPNQMKGPEIPLVSQIILITDAYFAMIEKRSYREELSKEKALEIIKEEAGKKWNEALVKEFIHLVSKHENSINLGNP